MAAPGPPVSQLFIDGGDQGALSAGHGHADALSIQLARDGKLWLADPGSFVYMGPERDRFRGTSAHNTLVVDGMDQTEPRGPFAWGPRPQVEVRQWIEDPAFDLFEGMHTGYQRLSEPVTHRRWVVGVRDGIWLIRDVAEGTGSHEFDVYLHFAAEVVLSADGAIARWGEETLCVAAADYGWKQRVETGEYSPVYGVRIPAPVLHWSTRAACPIEFAVVVAFGKNPGRLTRQKEGPQIIYEYESGAAGEAQRRFVFEADGGFLLV
jgi:hypothetical protein